jgi:hypothetical protein
VLIDRKGGNIKTFLFSFFSQFQYVEDDEEGRSEDGDDSDSPKPFDK